MKRKTRIAIIYDFDKTLATSDMQNFTFIPNLGMTPAEFWGKTGEVAKTYGMEKILSYLFTMVLECKEKNIPLTKKYLNECGKNIKLYPGVEDWFSRIEKYGKKQDVIIEHYLCSSGNKEIIEGTPIFKCFKEVYGCEFVFDPVTKEAVWPSNMINYTQKTQYLFRISKGALDDKKDDSINNKTVKRRIPYSNMIYLGDGITDVPCMEIIKNNGGHSIAIECRTNKDMAKKLVQDKRVQYIVKADYRPDSKLDKIVKHIIDLVKAQASLDTYDKIKDFNK